MVTRPQLIEAYKRIRLTKDETFIHVYAQMDEQYKEVSAFFLVQNLMCSCKAVLF